MREEDLYRFWGKARPPDDEGPQWHPLVFHCVDVAAVGCMFLREHTLLRTRLSTLLEVDEEQLVPLAGYLLALHDIGKFAKRFQSKVPHLLPRCFGEPDERSYDHGAGGMMLYSNERDLFGLHSDTPLSWRPLVSAVTGHHGAPPSGESPTVLPMFGKAGVEAARLFAAEMRTLFDLPDKLSIARKCEPASYALAGLAVLSDWVGSKVEWFPYQDRGLGADLRAYWHSAQERAENALRKSGVLPARPRTEGLRYSDLVKGLKGAPSPMQQWASSVDLPEGPALFMIEDETGSGKTEAALMLAHRLMAAGKADGLYMALPTMATANAMFARLEGTHRRLFADGELPSVVLAHGARKMHDGFRAAMDIGARREEPLGQAESDETASSACAAWIADDRRRSFLADVGAGTVDQALLSILPSKHQSLRLLGLMRNVLILDEVHAYDAYMQREIEALLRFQAGLGGSAILLSATLPRTIRRRLVDAFVSGLGTDFDEAPLSLDYPLASVQAGGSLRQSKVEGRADRARSVPVRFLRSVSEALDEVVQAANKGASVLYIRNSVDDALEARAELLDRGLDPANVDLFHARFALTDRLAIEERVLTAFGKSSSEKQRRGRVLVATQVVEQSLDLDFDVLVTDLAPIDLLIQRAGRLWRHERGKRPVPLELLVVSLPAVPDADETWYKRLFPRAAHVYKAHALLWLTAKMLEDEGEIDSPTRLRSLIESVYGEDAEVLVPACLEQNFLDAQGASSAERGIANTATLKLADGYTRRRGAWSKDVQTVTRIADDEHVTLRLARLQAGAWVPYAHDDTPGEPWRAWCLSEVNVPKRRVSGEAISPKHSQAASEIKASCGRYDEDKILILLDEVAARSGQYEAMVAAGEDGRKTVVQYGGVEGLKFV